MLDTETSGRIYGNTSPIIRMKFMLATARDSVYLRPDDSVTFLKMEAIGEQGELDLSESRILEDVASGYTEFTNGDVVVAKITPCFENGKGALISDLEPAKGFGTTELHVLSPSHRIDGKYLYYVTSSSWFRGLGESHMTGAAGQKRVPTDFVFDYPVWTPPIKHQRSIAAFLDRETEVIDELISEKESMLELLEEKQAALLSHSVTHGLDSNIQMKTTPIEWLGTIPTHWHLERLKFHILAMEQGWSPQCENIPATADEWGVLKVGAVNSWEFNPHENKRLPDELEPILDYEIKPRDVLMSRANTTQLLGSVVFVRNVDSKLMLCDKLYRLEIGEKRLNREFAVAFLRSQPGRVLFEMEATGASNSMQNIGQDTVKNTWIPVPPLSEQIEIVSYLSSGRQKTNEMSNALQESIALLRERRSALITAAVTGQISGEEMAQ